ncbi:MAG: prepilin-type N-terminal cleavage/methylation domain-containing protein [Candidatus Omnitrophica bacterium]|nr:prepilin-type N-terminal cleavage/methylation domain-containing protein [Candidatus Omnitrophota bacterium]
MNNKGVTLIESLVGILLLSILLIGVTGAYYLSLSSVNRGKHIAKANSILNTYMDQEMQAGYNDDGGSLGGAYYTTMPLATGGYKNVTIDDRGTTNTSDDLIGRLTCSPWYPDNIRTSGGDLTFDGIRYKIVGFIVSWVEKTPLMGRGQTYSVSAASYMCEREH